ncbi:MAG: hypothetical protein U5R49_01105 [Deltaproteobacteria bacterium]|nr:hypothetical protein [Deltaproteobacteria bacterium]
MRRLTDLQEKIDDILSLKSFEEKEGICRIVASAADFLEECEEMGEGPRAEAMVRVLKRIESVYGHEGIYAEQTRLHEMLHDITNEAISSMQGRELEIIRDFEEGHVVNQDRSILRKVFGGLLRNAIENTPDGGKIKVSLKRVDGEIHVSFSRLRHRHQPAKSEADLPRVFPHPGHPELLVQKTLPVQCGRSRFRSVADQGKWGHILICELTDAILPAYRFSGKGTEEYGEAVAN